VQEIANAMTIVAANGSLRSMKVLLTYGADIDGYDHLGKTPLTQALDHMQEVMVLYLLAQGANPNKPDLLGNRPLHWSINSEGEQSRFLEDEFGIVRPAHSRLTTLLIEFGATVTLCNHTGEFPIDFARAYGHTEAVTLLHRIHTTHTA
jgi:ankyrin repeat protein